MPATKFDKESIKNTIIGKIQRYNGLTIEEASKAQIYRAVASTVRDQMMQKVMVSREARKSSSYRDCRWKNTCIRSRRRWCSSRKTVS